MTAKQLDMILAKIPSTEGKPSNWKRAFTLLAFMTCTGWVSSGDISKIVDALNAIGEEEAANIVAAVFNCTRSKFAQDMMG